MIQKLLDSLQGMLDTAITAAPKVITGILLLIVALILAKIVERMLRIFLVRLKIDNLVGKAGIDTALQRIGLQQELSRFVPRLAYFLLLFLVARIAADTLGIAAVSDALNALFAYLPNLISALLLLVVGTTVGPAIGAAVASSAENSGMDFGAALGRLVSAFIVGIAGLMAVAQLKIDTEIIRLVTAFLLAAFALAFGLSFGLGTRDITRNIVAGFYARKFLRVGEPLELRGERGTLKAVTSTHTLIDRDEQTVSIANGALLDEVAKQ